MIKFVKRLAWLIVLPVIYVAIRFTAIFFAVLLLAFLAFFCIGAVWCNVFPHWDPRGYLEKRKEKKLMEFTNNRERG